MSSTTLIADGKGRTEGRAPVLIFALSLLVVDLVVGVSAPFAAPSKSLRTAAADTWAATASMATARASLTATALADGRVLVVGGSASELFADIYKAWSCWLRNLHESAQRINQFHLFD